MRSTLSVETIASTAGHQGRRLTWPVLLGFVVFDREARPVPVISPSGDVGAGDLAIDPFEEPGENAAGADLVKRVVAVGQHSTDGILPSYPLKNLGNEGAPDIVGIVVRSGVNVGKIGRAHV